MKRTDLAKNLGHKIQNKVKSKSASNPFSDGDGKVLDKREQRKLDQAMGLVPFAVKINIDLVEKIQNLAREKNLSINDVVTDLLKTGLKDSE